MILIDDYKRRISTVKQMIEGIKFKDDANPNYLRLKTKLSCFRTFLAELKKEENQDIKDLKWLVKQGATPEEIEERIKAIK